MPSVRSGETLAVSGLSQLQRALKHTEGDAPKQLKTELKKIGLEVRTAATGNISHRTGRHGKGARLGPSLKISVRQSGLSLYSNAPHAWVQDRGGRVGRKKATILERGKVSQYMTRAIRDEQPKVSRRMEALLNRLGQDFNQ